MKIEDAIQRQEFLKNTYTNCINGIDEHKGYYQKLVDSCDMAITALKKQIPKEPESLISDGSVKVGNCTFGKNTKVLKCKTCGSWVMPHWDFCSKCGQRLR